MTLEMGRKKAISVHVTDEERADFGKAMARDHMVDLGPWIATVVRKYIAGCDERQTQIDLIETTVLDIQKRMATKDDVLRTYEGPQRDD